MTHKSAYTAIFLKSAGIEATAENIKKYDKVWWFNYRSKSNGGLRLTDKGLQFITEESKIKTYKIDFPKEFGITPQVLVWLDKFIESPFFIDRRSITVLKEKSAFELYLFSGDIRKMGHNKAMAQRASQDYQPF